LKLFNIKNNTKDRRRILNVNKCIRDKLTNNKIEITIHTIDFDLIYLITPKIIKKAIKYPNKDGIVHQIISRVIVKHIDIKKTPMILKFVFSVISLKIKKEDKINKILRKRDIKTTNSYV
jgi:hypothetical protein